ncbi:MAG: RNA polymerase sigma factor [Limisphaerales bacterium]
MNPKESNSPEASADEVFVTTRWTNVVAARGDSPLARQALSDLCAAYYAPVVAFLRREGRDDDAARELAHEFFARVLQRSAFDRADPRRGRFRSYLLGALKHFLANRRVHEGREKRGAGAFHEPFPAESDTSPGTPIPAPSSPSPDAVFDREWAVHVLERAFEVMQKEAGEAGALHEFETLKPWLGSEGVERSQADAAQALGMDAGAVRVAIHRWRRRFRAVVKAEIAQTLNDPAEVHEELRHLIAALSA